jgi:tetratricopeptide (TPR) repeat protein
MTMSRELSANIRRLLALAALGVFWAALLAAVGVSVLVVAGLVAAVLVVAALGLEGRHLARKVRSWLRSAGVGISAAGRWAGAGVAGASRAVSARVRSVDWTGLRSRARRDANVIAQASRRGTAAVGTAAAAGSRRAVSAGAAAAAVVEAQAREIRLPQLGHPQGRHEALTLNERAAAARQRGDTGEALTLGEQALEIFRALGERHGEALTLNGIGLTQARRGDEAGAIDSYESAVGILTELGDSHGAGRVLANLGALHRSQGHDEQAQAYLHHALEQLEPGTPEHDRTAQQLRLAG